MYLSSIPIPFGRHSKVGFSWESPVDRKRKWGRENGTNTNAGFYDLRSTRQTGKIIGKPTHRKRHREDTEKNIMPSKIPKKHYIQPSKYNFLLHVKPRGRYLPLI